MALWLVAGPLIGGITFGIALWPVRLLVRCNNSWLGGLLERCNRIMCCA